MTDTQTFTLQDDGTFPNNSLPVLFYQGAVQPDEGDPCATFEQMFQENDWEGSWRNGIFKYHHYHAEAHEVLGCARGWVRVQLGGPNGKHVRLSAGDVVLLPAGTAHKNREHSPDYLIVGAYPPGQSPDMKHGTPEEYDAAVDAIAEVPMPDTDPVHGRSGGLLEEWIGLPPD